MTASTLTSGKPDTPTDNATAAVISAGMICRMPRRASRMPVPRLRPMATAPMPDSAMLSDVPPGMPRMLK